MIKENNLSNIFLILLCIFTLWILKKNNSNKIEYLRESPTKNNFNKIEYFAITSTKKNVSAMVKSFKDKPLDKGDYFIQFLFKNNDLATDFFSNFDETTLYFKVKNNKNLYDPISNTQFVLEGNNYNINSDYSLKLLSQGIYEYKNNSNTEFCVEFKRDLNFIYLKNNPKEYKLYNLEETNIYWLEKGIKYLNNMSNKGIFYTIYIMEGDILTEDQITYFISLPIIDKMLRLYNPRLYTTEKKLILFKKYLLNNLFATVIDPMFSETGINFLTNFVKISKKQEEFDKLPYNIKPMICKSLEVIHLQFLLKNYLNTLLKLAGEKGNEDNYKEKFNLISSYNFAEYSIYLNVIKFLEQKKFLIDRLKPKYSLTSTKGNIIIKNDNKQKFKFKVLKNKNRLNNISKQTASCGNNYINVVDNKGNELHFFISE